VSSSPHKSVSSLEFPDFFTYERLAPSFLFGVVFTHKHLFGFLSLDFSACCFGANKLKDSHSPIVSQHQEPIRRLLNSQLQRQYCMY
jgi:hypothetical protein